MFLSPQQGLRCRVGEKQEEKIKTEKKNKTKNRTKKKIKMEVGLNRILEDGWV